MEISSGISLSIAVTSAIIAGGFGYLLYLKTVGRWYASTLTKSASKKINHWCGILSLIAITQGITQILNEAIYATISGRNIKIDTISKGVIALLIFPILFALIAYALSFLVKLKNKILVNEPVVQTSLEKKEHQNFRFNTFSVPKIVIYILIFIAILTPLAFQLPSIQKNNAESKEFLFTRCTSCSQKGCKDSTNWKGFKVESTRILFFYVYEGMERIRTLPEEVDEKCTILKERNFAFECSKVDSKEVIFSSKTTVFDGKKRYEKSYETIMPDMKIWSKHSCDVVEK